MSSRAKQFVDAIGDRDADAVRALLVERSLVVIGIHSPDDDDESEPGTLRAEVDGFEALVAFTSEAQASEFVEAMDDLFDEGDEVEGLLVEGDALLELLAEGIGLLLNPEAEHSAVIDPELAKRIAE